MADLSIEETNSAEQDFTLPAEFSRLFRRDLDRLARELQAFSTEELLWEVVPGVNNSAGNLALHLEGNLREFIGRQLGRVSYSRQRELEFSSTGLPAARLTQRIVELGDLVAEVVGNLTSDNMALPYPEQALNYPMTTTYFLIHLYGHLNFHLGQVSYLRRILSATR